MSRALLQQALDALTYQGTMGPTRRQRRHAAITALRDALAQPEPEAAKPLTDEQINAIWVHSNKSAGGTVSTFARAIEAAHGIRPAPKVRRARPDDTEGGAI